MKIELEPTGRFETVNGVQCRLWKGASDGGVPVQAWIPLIQADKRAATAEQMAAFDQALRLVKVERQLVSVDMRMVV